MWFDRLTQKKLRVLPPQVESARYQWQGKDAQTLNSHSKIVINKLLLDDGGELCRLSGTTHSFTQPDSPLQTKITLFTNAINTIGQQLNSEQKDLLSPLLPAAVIDSESQLLPVEQYLQEILRKGHLHHISQRPRLDIRYSEEVTNIARAKRIGKGALVHLASHSECWQKQTLNGVIPKKIKARFSEDNFQIYENRVYVHLLDKLDIHLTLRTQTVTHLSETFAQALDFYESKKVYYQVSHKICALWGQTFNSKKTQETLNLLKETLQHLMDIHKNIRALKQHGLYLMLPCKNKLDTSLHRTNILTHDAHYRHLPLLWDKLTNHQQTIKYGSARSFNDHQQLAEKYSLYTGLVLQQALQQYLANDKQKRFYPEELTTTWLDEKKLTLKRFDYDWKLLLKDQYGKVEELLHIIPWMGFTKLPKNSEANSHQIIAHPSLDSTPEDSALSGNNSIALSPTDIYCVERVGWLIDQQLNKILLSNYGLPINKIPTCLTEDLTSESYGQSIEITNKSPLSFRVMEDLSNEKLSLLCKKLDANNAKHKSISLKNKVKEIRVLQTCPICNSPNNLQKEPHECFSIICPNCNSRYLKKTDSIYQLEFNIPNVDNKFYIRGRWYND